MSLHHTYSSFSVYFVSWAASTDPLLYEMSDSGVYSSTHVHYELSYVRSDDKSRIELLTRLDKLNF